MSFESIGVILSDILNDEFIEEMEVDEEFLKYYMQLISLNPEKRKDIFKAASRDTLKDNIQVFIDQVSDEKNPSILTLQMQNHFSKNYDTFENLIRRNQEKISRCTEVLLKDIVQANPSTDQENEKLLRRISIYLVLKSGMGNPGNLQVLREGTAALHSVFTLSDLKVFTEQRIGEKEHQLQELLSYVSGIRIFNKDCGKGGESIPELAKSLPDAIEATSLALSHCLIRIMERVNLLTTSIDEYISILQANKTVEIIIPTEKNICNDDYSKICKILTLYRQYEVFVRKLINDMDRIRVDNKELVLNFSVQLYELHSLVRYRTAVPADQVFPYFVQLWMYWQQMQNNMYVVSTINNIMWNLDSLHEKMEIPHEAIDSLLNGREIVSDAQRMQVQGDFKVEQRMNKCLVIIPTSETLDSIELQYLGFCALCLCVGALIPANPQLGICKWTDRHFVFCNLEHAKVFGTNPDRFIKEVLEYVRINIETVNFLKLYEDVYAVRNMTPLMERPPVPVKTMEKEMQTELHPIPTHIDKDYCWNIWDYRRKAVQLANIMNCKTHSTQTKYSYGKLEFGCQTDNMRDKEMQTMTDVGTSTPKPMNFIWGLRGQKEDVQHVINLTRPIDKACKTDK